MHDEEKADNGIMFQGKRKRCEGDEKKKSFFFRLPRIDHVDSQNDINRKLILTVIVVISKALIESEMSKLFIMKVNTMKDESDIKAEECQHQQD